MPQEIRKFFTKIKKELIEALGDSLFGIYIYGSLTYGGFRPKSSDIDCMVVVNEPLNEKKIDLLEKWHSKISEENLEMTKRLEMGFIAKDNLFSDSAKTPELYAGKFYREEESEANNPITWFNIRNTGKTIYGPVPKTFVPDISKDTITKALKIQFENIASQPEKFLKEDWSKVYVILTLCRILFTLNTEKITSKKKAADWCLKNAPKKYHALISSAANAFSKAANWESLNHPAHGINEHHRKEIILFEEYIKKQLNN